MPASNVTVNFSGTGNLLAYMAQLKAAVREQSEEFHHMSEELMAGINYNFGLWNVGMLASQKIMDGLIATFKGAVVFEQTGVQMRDLAGNAQEVAVQLAAIDKEAKLTGTDIVALEKVDIEMRKAGLSANDAAKGLTALDQYAKVTGEDIKRLAAEFTAIKMERGNVDAMLDLTAAMGQAGEPLHQQVVEYQRINTELPRIRNEQATIVFYMDRQFEMSQRQRAETIRMEDAQEQLADKAGVVEKIFRSMAEGGTGTATERFQVAGVALDKAAQVAGRRLELGEKQIQQEEGLNKAEVKRLESAGVIDAKMLEAAAGRARQEEEIVIQQSHEDAHWKQQAQFQDIGLKMQQAEVLMQQQIAAAVEDQLGLQKELADYQTTAASKWDKTIAAARELAEKYMPAISQWAGDVSDRFTDWVRHIQPVIDFLQPIIGLLNQMNDYLYSGLIKGFMQLGTELQEIWEEAGAAIGGHWGDIDAIEKKYDAIRQKMFEKYATPEIKTPSGEHVDKTVDNTDKLETNTGSTVLNTTALKDNSEKIKALQGGIDELLQGVGGGGGGGGAGAIGGGSGGAGAPSKVWDAMTQQYREVPPGAKMQWDAMTQQNRIVPAGQKLQWNAITQQNEMVPVGGGGGGGGGGGRDAGSGEGNYYEQYNKAFKSIYGPGGRGTMSSTGTPFEGSAGIEWSGPPSSSGITPRESIYGRYDIQGNWVPDTPSDVFKGPGYRPGQTPAPGEKPGAAEKPEGKEGGVGATESTLKEVQKTLARVLTTD
jgi:hypothetical protein